MNVYEKLAKARVMFQENNPKMSGKNTYAGYTYFELSDILPVINKIGAEIGFVCEVSFSKDEAVLTLRNTEKPDEYITFNSPMSSASLKGCHEVQNLGAVQTYLKRYLYQNCFEIVEADQLNAGEVAPPAQKAAAPKPTPADVEKAEKEYFAKFNELNNKLSKYLNTKGLFDRPDVVRQFVAAKDIKKMEAAVAQAEEREAAQKKQTAPDPQPEQFTIY